MPETVNWSATFDAVLGPRIAESGVLTFAAYDKISVELAGTLLLAALVGAVAIAAHGKRRIQTQIEDAMRPEVAR